MTKCQADKKDGTPCSRSALAGQKYCWQHQPKVKKEHGRFLIVSRVIKQLRNCVITLVETTFSRLETMSTWKKLSLVITIVLGTIALLSDLTGLGILPQLGRSSRMTGDFRIAIAGFEGVGLPRDSTINTDISQGVYLRLQQAFDDVHPDFTVTIWGPNQVGMIEGNDRDKRVVSAIQISEKIDADVVVYGLVESVDGVWQVTPEFYVSEKNFYEAAEITGQYEIGAPLTINGKGNVADRIEISGELASRIQVLSNITIGLAYYSIRNFEKALEMLQYTEEIETWEDKTGQQVLYILIGNAAAKNGDLELSKTYYHNAVILDPEYARAYVGLANVYYSQALKPFEETSDPSQIDAELLTLSVKTFEQAMIASNQPPLSDISTKVHFGLGQSYFAHVYSGNGEFFDAAVAEFQAVVEEYADGANPRVRELATESHARLGLIYDLSGYVKQASEEYQLAASLLFDNPERQAEYEQRARTLESGASEIQRP